MRLDIVSTIVTNPLFWIALAGFKKLIASNEKKMGKFKYPILKNDYHLFPTFQIKYISSLESAASFNRKITQYKSNKMLFLFQVSVLSERFQCSNQRLYDKFNDKINDPSSVVTLEQQWQIWDHFDSAKKKLVKALKNGTKWFWTRLYPTT